MIGNFLNTPPTQQQRKKSTKSRIPDDHKSIQMLKLQERVLSMEHRLSNLNYSSSQGMSQIKSCKVANKTPKDDSPYLFSSEKKIMQKNTIPRSLGIQLADPTNLRSKFEQGSFMKGSSPIERHSMSRDSYNTKKIQFKSNDPDATKSPYQFQDSLQAICDQMYQFRRSRREDPDETMLLAKMKCYCESNFETCFDFYRCQDSVTLKELEKQFQLTSALIHPNHDIPAQMRRIINQIAEFLEDLISQLSHMPEHRIYFQNLNEQIQRIKTEFSTGHTKRPSQAQCDLPTGKKYDGIKKHINQIELEFKELDQDRNELSLEKKVLHEKLQEQRRLNKQLQEQFRAYVQEQDRYQTTVSEQATEVVRQLKGKLKEEQADHRDQYAAQTEELESIKAEYQALSIRVVEINKSFDQVVTNHHQVQQERDELLKRLQALEKTHTEEMMQMERQIKREVQAHKDELRDTLTSLESKNKLIVELQSLSEMCQSQNEALNQDADRMRITCEEELRSLADQLMQQQKIIVTQQLISQQITVAVFASDILLRHSHDELPATLAMLQKDLAMKKGTIMGKMQLLRKFQENNYEEERTNDVTYDNVQQEINLLENLQSNRSGEQSLICGQTQFGLNIPPTAGNSSMNSAKSGFSVNEDMYCTLLIQCSTIERLLQN